MIIIFAFDVVVVVVTIAVIVLIFVRDGITFWVGLVSLMSSSLSSGPILKKGYLENALRYPLDILHGCKPG